MEKIKKKRNWSPERKKLFQQRMKAAWEKRRAAKARLGDSAGNIKDAIAFLEHAQRHMTKQLETKKIKAFDYAHLMALLALEELKNIK
jgi:hypothetical protein